MPEKEHRAGEQGVQLAKSYLESTTLVEINVTAYDNEALCKLQLLNGDWATFDMVGMFLGKRRDPVCAEVKNYRSAGKQHAHYLDFLATAYSVMLREIREGRDTGRHFMWLTTHPFSLKKWLRLNRRPLIVEALGAHPGYINHEEPDEEMIQLLSERIWFIVGYPRLPELLMSRKELNKIMGKLRRKG
ncbi:hypothetical protein [Quadrisphaera sp. KR29]|uniref:hypothetical protein n=1 Tax=Quadrisphaera sp. KR29 TaxID=3461391 RepID=UPI0040442840